VSVTVHCPTCGAKVEFRFDDSFVRICDSCQNALVRGDRTFESLGRVADLAASGSPLDLGLDGQWRGVRFSLVGRAQLRHAAGGLWDEWYAHFDDGRWGWLAESQGRFQLTFEVEPPVPGSAEARAAAETRPLPTFSGLAAGDPVELAASPRVKFTAVDVGEATYQTARGEIPFRLVPGQRFRYADLSGAFGAFATIDYGHPLEASGEPPDIYLGWEVTLDQLAIVRGAGRGADEGPRDQVEVRGARLACPQCGGSVDLKAPGSLRLVCPYCGGLLDIAEGKLAFLGKPKSKPTPTLKLGSTARFEGEELTVIGFILREAIIDGTAYPFEEHLLYHPRLGYRWLVLSDGHWSYVAEVAAGDVDQEYSTVRFGGRSFSCFQRAGLRVAGVLGELPWRVEPGETVEGIDYIAPPYMMSVERGAGEIHWSRGTWLSTAEVEQATGAEKLPQPLGVAPNQPFRQRPVLGLWAPAFAVWAVVSVIQCGASGNRHVAGGQIDLDALAAAPPQAEASSAEPGAPPPVQPPPPEGSPLVFFSEPFLLVDRENILVHVSAPSLSDSWVSFAGDVIGIEDGTAGDSPVVSFDTALEEWHGYEDGESWHEGSQSEKIFLSAMPDGMYVLRLEIDRQAGGGLHTVDWEIEQDVFRWTQSLLVLLLISIVPMLVALWWFFFERRRWRDSEHAPSWARPKESD
jgi:uncharacterized protein DUF4178